jgi:hypothetical protein
VYYKENQRIIELLKQAEKLSEKKLPGDFSKFDVYPYRDLYYKMLSKGEVVGDNLVESVHREYRSGSYSSLDSYRMYFDTDDMETYAGRGAFGRDKYVDKYCYRSLSEATRELEKDLRSALGYCADDIQNYAKDVVSALVDVYNKDVKEALSKKIALL